MACVLDRRGRRSANHQRARNAALALGEQALIVADEVEPLDARRVLQKEIQYTLGGSSHVVRGW
jgi:hypothetical protein